MKRDTTVAVGSTVLLLLLAAGCGEDKCDPKPLAVSSDFESGSIGEVEQTGEDAWSLSLRNDNDTWGQNCAVDNGGYNGGFWYTDCYQLSMLHRSGNLYSLHTNVTVVVTHNELYFR